MVLKRNEKTAEQARRMRAGARIRARRMDQGIKQVDLARDCEISPAYLNLIEHDRRAIGGALLNRIADHLGVDVQRLAEGAGSALTTALGAAAAARPGLVPGEESAEDMAQRFPGHARLVERLYRDTQRLERQVEVLGDRMTHDPHLSASLHNVLSSVTAIRSTSAILTEDDDLPPDWLARFHRNIHEDSRRLAEAADGLVRYLDPGAAESDDGAVLPQEAVETWLAAQDWRIEALEDDPGADPAAILAASEMGRDARQHARALLARYAEDARALDGARLDAARAELGDDPHRIAAHCGTPLSLTLRRLATRGEGAFGLVVCDASGTLTFRRPLEGFPLPRYGSACPLWPLFDTLRQPQVPVRATVEMPGEPAMRFACDAIAEIGWPDGYDGTGVVEAVMLIRPVDDSHGAVRSVGPSCRICPRRRCAARREPSIVASAQD